MEANNQYLPQNDREFDVIVFGASGFTGQFVVEEVARTAKSEPIKWAISGRSAQKLAKVLTTATQETGIDVNTIPIIEADVSCEESLKAMTSRTKIVLNCVGPYRFFGEQVVKVCVETSTNHLDISAEPQYLESMQLKYNNEAKEKGIYVIGCCGFDCIPIDLGVQYLKSHFDGTLNSVQTYTTIKCGAQKLVTNYGTWQSVIHGVAAFRELAPLKRRFKTEIYTKRPPKSKFRIRRKIIPFQCKHVSGWSVPWPTADRWVVQRTQQFKFEEENQRPIQIETYFNVRAILDLLGILLLSGVFGALVFFKCGRSLLESHPKFLSFGFISREGPTRQQLRDVSFITTIVGKGWDEKLTEPTDESTVKPNKTVVVKVKGKDPYAATSTLLVQSGFTLLRDLDKMPQNGGVLTPGAAFDYTRIYDRLKQHGVTFEVVNQ